MLSLWANWLVTKFGLNSLKRYLVMTCTVGQYMFLLSLLLTHSALDHIKMRSDTIILDYVF